MRKILIITPLLFIISAFALNTDELNIIHDFQDQIGNLMDPYNPSIEHDCQVVIANEELEINFKNTNTASTFSLREAQKIGPRKFRRNIYMNKNHEIMDYFCDTKNSIMGIFGIIKQTLVVTNNSVSLNVKYNCNGAKMPGLYDNKGFVGFTLKSIFSSLVGSRTEGEVTYLCDFSSAE